jgi:hypothetical protein
MMTDPVGTGSSADDFLGSLVSWCSDVFDDVLGLLTDPVDGPGALAELGWQGGLPQLPPELAARLSSVSGQRVRDFGTLITDFKEFCDVLEATPGGNAANALAVVADGFEFVATSRLRSDRPVLWAVLRLLALISDDGAQLGNLADLVGDTRQYLVNRETGPGYQQHIEDWSALILGAVGITACVLFGEDGRTPLPQGTRSELLYGWKAADSNDHPNLMTILGRTLTWRVLRDTSGLSKGEVGGAATLTVALVPDEHNLGAWGVFLRVSGDIEVARTFGTDGQGQGWKLDLTLNGGDGAEILAGANGFVRSAAAGLAVSANLQRTDSTKTWIVGDPTRSHLEIKNPGLHFKLNDGPTTSVSLTGHLDDLMIDIKTGQDSFLSAVLPPEIRVNSALGLGFDTDRGFYFDGGAKLVVDLPIDVELGPAEIMSIQLQALHLRLGIDHPAASPAPAKVRMSAAFAVDASVVIAGGIAKAAIAGIGVSFDVTQLTGPLPTPSVGGVGRWLPEKLPVPPTGLGLQINAGPVAGGGFIKSDPDAGEYSGGLQLHLGLSGLQLDLTALGMLDTRIAGHDGQWALLLLLAAQTTPGIQLGFGFVLSGFGGVVGINHTLDTDAIAAGLRTRSLDAILFPPDPVAQAPHIFALWRQIMPVAAGRTIVGPMVQLGWGGAANLCTLEAAILIELDPNPVQIVMLGSFRLSAPSDGVGLVRLRADVMGRLRLNPLDFLLEAELVDSRLGTFVLSGGMVMVARGGQDSAFLASFGGFNPHYQPPAGVPAVDRIRVDISGSNNPRLRLEGYVAITSQTFQFGARAELHAAAGPLSLEGWLGLDVLIAWLPRFHFSAEVYAGVSLSFHGEPVLELSIDVLLEGPGPWHVKGHASLHLLFFTVSLPIDASWGEDAGPTAAVASPLDLVRSALSKAEAWSSQLPPGATSVVTFRASRDPAVIPVHPLAVIACHQRVAPLGLTLTHVGNQPLVAPTIVDITELRFESLPVTDSSPVEDLFAPGEFLNLTDDEAFSRPSFETMRAGLTGGSSASLIGLTGVVASRYKTILIDGPRRTEVPATPLSTIHRDHLLSPPSPVLGRPRPPMVGLVADTLRSVDGAEPVTASLAAQSAGVAAKILDGAGMAGAL